MKKLILIGFILFLRVTLSAQISVSPPSINVNSQNPTSVPLTFGPLSSDYRPVEAIWCGELTLSAGIGQTCRPDTIYGSLPERYNKSQRRTLSNGGDYLFDVMAVPASVTRRAYQTAQSGGSARFFYVRRFVSNAGNPDIFVNVICRMGGGGARTPFTITAVKIRTPDEKPILFLKSGNPIPPVYYELQYNGSGTLRGRWEIVQPGEEMPSEFDLLPEAALPIDQRGQQKLYTQVSRFDVFLPPSGKYLLPAPDRIPNYVEGQYFLLLRLEVSFDRETEIELPFSNVVVIPTPTPTPTVTPTPPIGTTTAAQSFADTDLASLNTAVNAVSQIDGQIQNGGTAAFPMPFLRIQVGAFNDKLSWIKNGLITKNDKQLFILNSNPQNLFETIEGEKAALNSYAWYELKNTDVYLVEFVSEADVRLLGAYVSGSKFSYHLPKILRERFKNRRVYWRVSALKNSGKLIARTDKQRIM
ncbi:MAG: hypothetical protein K1X72_18735 [Pyrinomonadaceae bacterium]|nr:hypothetical protein [Pyrinomonadaceae bacterium]